jgi:hypothetical protein
MNKYPAVFMDETGNSHKEPHFSCGFLEVSDVNLFHIKLRRIRDQIKGLALRDRQSRIALLKEECDMEQLFQFAYKPSSFELKFSKVTAKNLKLYQDLVKVMARKTDMSFTVVMMNKADYPEARFLDLYRSIVSEYYAPPYSVDTIFVPDEFDTSLSWDDVIVSDRIIATIPIESHSCIALQCCDVLGGIIALGCKSPGDYTNSDKVRLPLLKTFEEEFGCKVSSDFRVNEPRNITVKTVAKAEGQ